MSPIPPYSLFAPPIREHDGRRTMRSLADALDRLRGCNELCDDDSIILRTNPVRLPDGRASGVVVVLRIPQDSDPISVVRMPSAAKFLAATTLPGRAVYDIAVLNNAVSDCDGNVQLANGEYLHQIDLLPAPCHYEFTTTEHAIVQHALRFLAIEDRCYRSLHDELLPNELRLDYQSVAQVRIDRLKPVQQHVMRHVPNVSMSFIASTLRRAGMSLPRSPV